jgi:hypothetical protein
MNTETKTAASQQPAGAAPKVVVPPRSFMQSDFPHIRRAVLVFVLAAGIGGLAIAASQAVSARLHASQAQAQALRDQANRQFSEAQTQLREIREFEPGFLQLQANGFIGDEKRLDLLENLRAIQRSRALFPIEYDIAPQQPVQLDPSVAAGGMELRGSRLAIRLPLLHEMDLFNLLDDLNRVGLYVPQHCAIQRLDAVAETGLIPHLSGECALYWITLGDRAPS